MAVSHDDRVLQGALLDVLRRSPGLPAKAIARELREMLGQEIYKADINPMLYGQRGIFRFDGYSPPRWFVIETPQPATTLPAAFPVPRQVREIERAPRSPAPAPRPVRAPAAPRIGPVPPPRRFLPPPPANPLYRWQEEALAAWYENGGRGVIEAVTGTGKTRVALQLLRDLFAQGKRTLIVVPSVALQGQWSDALLGEFGFQATSLLGGGHGDRLDLTCPVTIGVVNTVSRIGKGLESLFDCVIADECHHYGSPTRRKALLPEASLRLGLTATFERSDNGIDDVLAPYFAGKCYEYGFSRAKTDGVIAPYSVLAIGVDLDAAERETYDLASDRMARSKRELVNTFGYPVAFASFMERVNRKTIRLGRELALTRTFTKAMQLRREVLSESSGKRAAAIELIAAIQSATHALMFTETITSADDIAILLQDAGLRAEMYHTDLGPEDRREVLDDLVGGELDCVVGVRALDEGIDVPDVDLGIVVAGTKQRRQMIQRMGRVLRKKDDGRGAAFIVLYARGTSEDPTTGHPSGHLDTLLQHADNIEIWHASELSTRDVGEQVFEWIWDPGPRSLPA